MDLTTVTAVRQPRSRADLRLGEREAFLGGGSWLFSEPQLELDGLVDLTTLGWQPITVTAGCGLSIAATCTFTELAALEARADWTAHPLLAQCCSALLGSFKVWNTATVGGNICLALPAGPMTSLTSALDADALIWTPDGGERRMPVLELVVGDQSTALEHGELLRSVEIPASSLRARVGMRKIALSPLGRSGTIVIARVDEGGEFVATVSAGTERPVQLRFDAIPTADDLADGIGAIDCWYDDAHGAPDWRRAMSILFAGQLRDELAAPADDGTGVETE
ncbi:FAD binding domain-containing protein [Marisediminicola senii]|uniref:FAD binding domain-containing protein n=1 Tax=Marisediminicola senii TaxID=2711233 RepID=UPI0013EA94CA|nr:FAD binding domain-containing protein [Marisediminicola senii]